MWSRSFTSNFGFRPCLSPLSFPARRRSRPPPPSRLVPVCAQHYCAHVGVLGCHRRGLHRRRRPPLCIGNLVGSCRPARAVKTKIWGSKCSIIGSNYCCLKRAWTSSLSRAFTPCPRARVRKALWLWIWTVQDLPSCEILTV